MCRSFVDEFTSRYANTKVLYASKAYVNPALARLVHEEGLGLDVVSGGELAVAAAAGVPMSDVYFHGNNKSPEELEMAVDAGIGRVVVDSFYELGVLDAVAKARGRTQDIMLRLSPGIDPHTHAKTTTGILDSKFGFSIETGDAAEAIRQALAARHLDLVGIHFHLGSPIFELEPYSIAVDTVLTYLAPFKSEGLDLREFSPGGGFAIGYVREQGPPPISSYAEVITSALKARRRRPEIRRAPAHNRARQIDRGTRRSRAVQGGRHQGHPDRAEVRLARRRHGRQHTPCPLRVAIRGRDRQPHARRAGRAGYPRGQVLRVRGHPGEGHHDAAAGDRRPGGHSGVGSVRALHGEQLQPEPSPGGGAGAGRPGSPHQAARDLRRHDGPRRGRIGRLFKGLRTWAGRPSATRRLRERSAGRWPGGRLPHAILIAGPESVGKMALAVDLAAALNCAGDERPCGECGGCTRTRRGLHTDVHVVGIQVAGGGRNRTLIGVEQVREVQREASLAPFEGECKVVIFDGAELLSEEASNSLLKTLEEPPPGVYLLLLTAKPEALLSDSRVSMPTGRPEACALRRDRLGILYRALGDG